MTKQVDSDQWQCGKSLPDCLNFMLENEIACDVEFLVGKKKLPVKAHKTILISRSPVFYAMLNGPLKETKAINVPDIDDKVFKQVLSYMYTDSMKLTEETAIPILYAAKKYCLDGLSQQCVEYLTSSITEENVFILYEQAHLYEEQNLEENCWKIIKRNPKKCFESVYFLKLCPSCCEKIVSSDGLNVKEEFIYERVLNWAEAECTRQQLEFLDINKRNVLGSILYKIRFPLIDQDYFAQHILNGNLLTSDEKVIVMSFFLKVEDRLDRSLCPFDDKKRKLQKGQFDEKVIRYGCASAEWGYGSKSFDKINFMVSKDVFLHGVVLYGDKNGSEYGVDLDILEESQKSIASIKTKYKAIVSDYTSDILLETPVLLNANKTYNVVTLISGPNSYKGNQGMVSVTIKNDIVITFSNESFQSKLKSNGTSVFQGQIPGLLLSYT